MIVLDSPEGMDRPEGGRRQADRGHVPRRIRCRSRTRRRTPRTCGSSKHGCAAIGRRSCSTSSGRLRPELAELAPEGERRMGANPHANGGLLLRDLRLPDFREYAGRVCPRRALEPATRASLGGVPARRHQAQCRAAQFPRSSVPTRRISNGLEAVFEATSRQWDGQRSQANDEYLRARGPGDGDAERAPMRGLARGLSAHRPSRPVQLLRGLHPYHRFDVQSACEVAQGHARHCRGGARSRR